MNFESYRGYFQSLESTKEKIELFRSSKSMSRDIQVVRISESPTFKLEWTHSPLNIPGSKYLYKSLIPGPSNLL